jgi:hypothetical protein
LIADDVRLKEEQLLERILTLKHRRERTVLRMWFADLLQVILEAMSGITTASRLELMGLGLRK